MKLVILDRDGVINQYSDKDIVSAEQWRPIEGSPEAIAQLHQQGYTVVVATNQPGLALGLFDLDDLEAMHAKLIASVEAAGGEVAAIFYCPHGPDDRCNCRKPKAGLIDAIEAEFDTSAQGVPFIGDSLRDLTAGLSKGCTPMLVTTGEGEQTLAQLAQTPQAELDALPVFNNLAAAARHIIEEDKGLTS